jgi:hypothetical protein
MGANANVGGTKAGANVNSSANTTMKKKQTTGSAGVTGNANVR